MSNYDDIITLNHKEPNYKHPRMSIYKRSAQFAPFAALSGFEESIDEASRIAESKVELDDNKKLEINEIINLINKQQEKRFKVKYFIKDKTKNGGKYIETEETLKRIDAINKVLVCNNKKNISIESIIEINML